MWLVVIEVRSKSFGLITECRHYNECPINVVRLLYIVLFRTSAAVDMMYTNQKQTQKIKIVKYIKINTQKIEKRKKQQTNKKLVYEDYVTQTVQSPQ